MSKVPNVLVEATGLIYGDREKDYGHPATSLGTIAAFWQTYLRTLAAKNVGEIVIEPADVAVMMSLLKTSRFLADKTKRDTWVDGAGYWGLVERCGEKTQAESRAVVLPALSFGPPPSDGDGVMLPGDVFSVITQDAARQDVALVANQWRIHTAADRAVIATQIVGDRSVSVGVGWRAKAATFSASEQ